jgi:hypothetical protein
VLSATSLKYFGEPVKLSVGQRLCAHDPKFARWRISDIDSCRTMLRQVILAGKRPILKDNRWISVSSG